jgi:hypothetical protein
VRGRKGAQGQPFVLIAPQYPSRGDEAVDPCKMQQKVLYTLRCLPDSSHIMPSLTRYMETVSKMGPMIAMDLLELRVPRQNPPVGSTPPRAHRMRDKATQRVASNQRYLGPHREDPTSSSFVSESRLGGFCHTPPFGLASSRPGSCHTPVPIEMNRSFHTCAQDVQITHG